MSERPDCRLSVFDMLKVGVGPSSSHTMGPWVAARRFVREAIGDALPRVDRVVVHLYGSLAKTGRGHATDIAVPMGLEDADAQTIDPAEIPRRIDAIRSGGTLQLGGRHSVAFDADRDLQFHSDRQLPAHPNAMTLEAITGGEVIAEATYYSVGGGFVLAEGDPTDPPQAKLPLPIDTAEQLLAHCDAHALAIHEVVRRNERAWRDDSAIDARLDQLRQVMDEAIFRGCRRDGVLPGGLGIRRRAASTANRLLPRGDATSPEAWFAAIRDQPNAPGFSQVLDWVGCFALAVNEENASLGRIVTAPTNGAAGVIPAVLKYYQLFCGATDADARQFLLTAGEIGCLFKKGATISAAMGGCQAEIGVSSAMAAAALAEGLGGTPAQAAAAAEIAMEHHLGMTCDPIGGLVQAPCIERNALGAVKAITAAQLALARDPADCRVSLDGVIRTMWLTAQDMHSRYKETSEGGLAVLVPVNVPEC